MPIVYGTVVGADTYNAERGRIEWAALDNGDKETGLLLASEYIDREFGTLFSGWKTGLRPQVRQWPRTGAWANDGGRIYTLPPNEIPVEVEHATYELALRAATGTALTVDFNASEAIKKAAVEGAVSVEYWGSGSIEDAQTVFPIVASILTPLLTGDGAGFSSLSGSRVRV